MSDSDLAYTATAPCGCIYMVTVDNPAHAKDVAKAVSKAIREGAAIERVTVAEAREKFKTDCPHDPKWGGI